LTASLLSPRGLRILVVNLETNRDGL
jgi:hypothetical protein